MKLTIRQGNKTHTHAHRAMRCAVHCLVVRGPGRQQPK